MIEADADANIEITEGDAVAFIPADRRGPGARPKPLAGHPPGAGHGDPHRRRHRRAGRAARHRRAPRELDARAGTAFGGLTVATAEFATDDPELPITFAAREGEPVVLAAGDAHFEL